MIFFLHLYNIIANNKPKANRQRYNFIFHGSLQINGFVHMLWAWECHVYKMAVLVQNTLPDNVYKVGRAADETP